MLTIRTNHTPRNILSWGELTTKEQKEFDWDNANECDFFRYKGNTYCLSEFMRVTTKDLSAWDGYMSDSFFSGILVKFTNENESIIAGTYYS